MARRGNVLLWLGAGLLLLSAATFGSSRFLEWQHALESAAVAPRAEVLAERLTVPSPTVEPRTP
jgi:hypothetical protein